MDLRGNRRRPMEMKALIERYNDLSAVDVLKNTRHLQALPCMRITESTDQDGRREWSDAWGGEMSCSANEEQGCLKVRLPRIAIMSRQYGL